MATTELPYSTVPNRLKDFLSRLPSQGVPAKLTVKELELRGFRSSNDRSIIRVVRSLGLVDDSGTPTEMWRLFRDRAGNRPLLADLVQTTYRELFDTFPDAPDRSERDLQNYMSTKTGAPESTVQLMVKTFKTLCELADFGFSEQIDTDLMDRGPVEAQANNAPSGIALRKTSPVMPPIHITININLPDTDRTERIDAIFKSMAVHLMGRPPDVHV